MPVANVRRGSCEGAGRPERGCWAELYGSPRAGTSYSSQLGVGDRTRRTNLAKAGNLGIELGLRARARGARFLPSRLARQPGRLRSEEVLERWSITPRRGRFCLTGRDPGRATPGGGRAASSRRRQTGVLIAAGDSDAATGPPVPTPGHSSPGPPPWPPPAGRAVWSRWPVRGKPWPRSRCNAGPSPRAAPSGSSPRRRPRSIGRRPGERRRFDGAQLQPGTAATLALGCHPTASTSNPVRLAGGGRADFSSYGRVIDTLLGSGEVDAVLLTVFSVATASSRTSWAGARWQRPCSWPRLVTGVTRPLLITRCIRDETERRPAATRASVFAAAEEAVQAPCPRRRW